MLAQLILYTCLIVRHAVPLDLLLPTGSHIRYNTNCILEPDIIQNTLEAPVSSFCLGSQGQVGGEICLPHFVKLMIVPHLSLE